jgi:hypothetical protein
LTIKREWFDDKKRVSVDIEYSLSFKVDEKKRAKYDILKIISL